MGRCSAAPDSERRESFVIFLVGNFLWRMFCVKSWHFPIFCPGRCAWFGGTAGEGYVPFRHLLATDSIEFRGRYIHELSVPHNNTNWFC